MSNEVEENSDLLTNHNNILHGKGCTIEREGLFSYNLILYRNEQEWGNFVDTGERVFANDVTLPITSHLFLINMDTIKTMQNVSINDVTFPNSI